MSVNVITIILACAYFAIGAFLAGLEDDSEDAALIVIIFWPVIYAIILLFSIFSLPYKFGSWIRGFFDNVHWRFK